MRLRKRAPVEPPPDRSAQTNTMAVMSVVFAFVFPPLGIVFAHRARRQIAKTGEAGRGTAFAGLVIGYILTVVYVVGCAIFYQFDSLDVTASLGR